MQAIFLTRTSHRVRSSVRTCLNSHTYPHIPPSQNTHTHPNTQTSTHECGHTHERRQTYAHTRTHTRTHTHVYAHIHLHMHTCAHANKHTRANTHTHACARTPRPTYTHPCMGTRRRPIFLGSVAHKVDAHQSSYSLQNCLPLFQLRPPLHVVLLTSLTSCSCRLFSFEIS